MISLALLAALVGLSLGTAGVELGAGIALGVALWRGERSCRPLLGPVALVAASWALAAAPHDLPALREALGRSWPLAPMVAVPMLAAVAAPGELERAERWGLRAAAGAGWLALAQALIADRWPPEVAGPYDHHLTLGYALLVPLGRALWLRRPWPALGMGLGLLCAGGSGPLLSALVLVIGLGAPRLALSLGVLAALGGLIWLGPEHPELHQRLLLWATGAELMAQSPLGVGPDGFREAAVPVQDALEPGFYFPTHAHHSALQLGALAGPGAWLAWIWLLVRLWARAEAPGRAALAALLVGSLTQDTLGDLEVIRALGTWALVPVLRTEPPPTSAVSAGTLE